MFISSATGAIPLHNPLSPISEEYANVEREVGAKSAESMQAESEVKGGYMWEHPSRYKGSSTLPTSLPEEERDISFNRAESATPQPKIRERWRKAFEVRIPGSHDWGVCTSGSNDWRTSSNYVCCTFESNPKRPLCTSCVVLHCRSVAL